MISGDTLHGVLLDSAEGETTAVLRWSSESKAPSEQKSSSGSDLSFDDSEVDSSGSAVESGIEEEDEDVTIRFGDQGGGEEDMFMGSEFDQVEEEAGSFDASFDDSSQAESFQQKLDALLSKCADRGYEDPEIAFCSSALSVEKTELHVDASESGDFKSQGDEDDSPSKPSLPVSRDRLLEQLQSRYDEEIEDRPVAFLPMSSTAESTKKRVLALLAPSESPLLSTLDSMQNRALSRSPQTRLLDTEISLYSGLTRSVLNLPPDSPERSIFVRVGRENTLVLFIRGNTLLETEHLPELTINDSAETICSRVLLLQDEYGMGEVQNIVLVAEEEEGVLGNAFRSYFSAAELHILRSTLPGAAETSAAGFVAATGAALRLLEDPSFHPHFRPTNLLAEEFIASRMRLPVGWQVPALLTLLATVTLAFVWLYFFNRNIISDKRAKLRQLRNQLESVDKEALQTRIDSLEAAGSKYTGANETVSKLLSGSNKWSRTLATLTAQMNDVRGLRAQKWTPQGAAEVTLIGRSNDRGKVSELARRLDGQVMGVTFTETRDVTLFDFEMTVPLDTSSPEAIAYWRNERGEKIASPSASSSSSPSSSSSSPTASVSSASEKDVAKASGPSSFSSPSWTVVVGSFQNNAFAQKVSAQYDGRFESDTLSVAVLEVPERSLHRVVIGPFTSFQSALALRQSMSSALPEGAWLLQIDRAMGKSSLTDASEEGAGPNPSISVQQSSSLSQILP
jgi:hypothetical protein